MSYLIDAAAPQLVAEAFIRGERRREIALSEFRGGWAVVSLAARRADVLALAEPQPLTTGTRPRSPTRERRCGSRS